jgi:CBS domain-containing protein
MYRDILHDLELVRVGELLKARGKRTIFCLQPGDRVQLALQKMAEQEHGAVIVTQGRQALGIFTYGDFARKLAAQGIQASDAKIEDYMSGNVLTVSPSMSLLDVVTILASNRVQHLPVADEIGDALDEDTRIVDVINARDIFQFLLKKN